MVAVIPNIRAQQYLGTLASANDMVAWYHAEVDLKRGLGETTTVGSWSASQMVLEWRDSTNTVQYTITVGVNRWIIVEDDGPSQENVSNARYQAGHRTYADTMTDLLAASTPRSFTNGAARSLTASTGASGFQVSATRDAVVGYSAALSTTATIGGAATATVVLEVCPTNSATPANWTEIARISNSQTITLAVALQSVQVVTAELSGIVPAGYFAKLRSTTTGTASATYISGQEVLL